MRNALPNAAFLGFTGTPLITGEEERTREVFGDYVSIYDFAAINRGPRDRAALLRKPDPRSAADQRATRRRNRDDSSTQRILDEDQEKKLQRRIRRGNTTHHP